MNAFPGVEEGTSWGMPTFRVRGKVLLKAAPGVQELLVGAEPEKFFIPPYQGPFGWIGVHMDRNEDREIAFHVRQAYRLVAPKKLLSLLSEDQD